MDPLPDRYLVVNGLRVRYWQAGDQGPNLVLIHGLGGAVEVWRRVMPGLARSHRVVALDLPGCGRSQRPLAYPADTLALFATTVIGFMDALGISAATVIGSSLGGAVALETAIAAPNRVRDLVLIGSAGFSPSVAWSLRLLSLPGVGELLSKPARNRTAVALRSCVANPLNVTELDIDLAYAMASMPGAHAAFLSLLRVYCRMDGLHRPTVRRLANAMPTLPMPVLLVWGDRDAIVPLAVAERSLALLPAAALVVYTGCGHLAFVEQPADFTKLVAAFVGDPVATLAAHQRRAPDAAQHDGAWRRGQLRQTLDHAWEQAVARVPAIGAVQRVAQWRPRHLPIAGAWSRRASGSNERKQAQS